MVDKTGTLRKNDHSKGIQLGLFADEKTVYKTA